MAPVNPEKIFLDVLTTAYKHDIKPFSTIHNKPPSLPDHQNIIIEAQSIHYRRKGTTTEYSSVSEIPDDIMRDVFSNWKDYVPPWFIDKITDKRAIELARASGLMTLEEYRNRGKSLNL
jgi:uncharacterized secreted protein with C-terminal beta-propeller domain